MKVPFLFLPLNDPTSEKTLAEAKKVQSHFDMTTLVIGLLGYDVMVENSSTKEIYINGSDLLGMAGELRLQLAGSKVQSVELINGVGDTPKVEDFTLPD